MIWTVIAALQISFVGSIHETENMNIFGYLTEITWSTRYVLPVDKASQTFYRIVPLVVTVFLVPRRQILSMRFDWPKVFVHAAT